MLEATLRKKLMVRFSIEDRRVMLKKSRQFVDNLSDEVHLIQGEHFDHEGVIYVIVEGTEEDVARDLHKLRVGGKAVGFSLLDPGYNPESFQCIMCDNRSDRAFIRCPACGAAEISPCPHCSQEVPRLEYLYREGNKASCPRCATPVYLTFGDLTKGPVIRVLRGVP